MNENYRIEDPLGLMTALILVLILFLPLLIYGFWCSGFEAYMLCFMGMMGTATSISGILECLIEHRRSKRESLNKKQTWRIKW